MAVDEALHSLGLFGKWQILTYVFVSIVFSFPSSWQLFAIVFIGVINPHHCKIPSNSTLEDSIPKVKNQWSQCRMYVNKSTGNDTSACKDGWQYDLIGFDPDGGTITMEWDLVCGKGMYVETSQTIFMAGTCLGSAVFTPLADIYGRKKLLFFCQIFMAIFGVAMAYTPNYLGFCAFQFLTGAFAQGLCLAGFVLACELFPTELRAIMAPTVYLFWAAGMMTLSLWAYFLRHWRHLQLAISIPSFLSMLYYFFCPESIRWLVAMQHIDEAENLFKNAAKMNHVQAYTKLLWTDSDEIQDLVSTITPYNNQQEKSNRQSLENVGKQSLISLLRSPKCRRYTLIMMYLVVVNYLTYFGLSLMTGILPGDRYVNFFVVSVLEVPATIAGIIMTHRFGRRKPLSFFHVFTAVMFGGGALISAFSDKGTLLTSFALGAKFGLGGTWAIELIYAQEIFPTAMRNTGLGLITAFGIIGSILAPYANFLARISTWMPLSIFSILTIFGAIMCLYELETHYRPLPTTIEQIENWPLLPTSEERKKGLFRFFKNKRHASDKSTNIFTVQLNDGKYRDHGNSTHDVSVDGGLSVTSLSRPDFNLVNPAFVSDSNFTRASDSQLSQCSVSTIQFESNV